VNDALGIELNQQIHVLRSEYKEDTIYSVALLKGCILTVWIFRSQYAVLLSL